MDHKKRDVSTMSNLSKLHRIIEYGGLAIQLMPTEVCMSFTSGCAESAE